MLTLADILRDASAPGEGKALSPSLPDKLIKSLAYMVDTLPTRDQRGFLLSAAVAHRDIAA